jgi:tetratricopeptide (TPR) repeat protein
MTRLKLPKWSYYAMAGTAFLIWKREGVVNFSKCVFYSAIARHHVNNKRFDKALVEFDKITDLNPPTHLEKANIYNDLQDYANAVAEIDQYLKKSNLEIMKAIASLKKGDTLMRMKEYDRAIEVYEKMLKETPYNPEDLKSRVAIAEWKKSQHEIDQNDNKNN